MCSPSFMQIVFVLCIWVFKCLTLFSEGIILKKTKSSKTKIPFNKVIFHTLATHNSNLRQELGQKNHLNEIFTFSYLSLILKLPEVNFLQKLGFLNFLSFWAAFFVISVALIVSFLLRSERDLLPKRLVLAADCSLTKLIFWICCFET